MTAFLSNYKNYYFKAMKVLLSYRMSLSPDYVCFHYQLLELLSGAFCYWHAYQKLDD